MSLKDILDITYYGRMDDMGGQGHTGNIVLNLMKPFLHHGYALYMNNFYNSFKLASKLLTLDSYCTSTLHTRQKLNSKEVTEKRKFLKKGKTISSYTDIIMIGGK